MRGHIVPMSYLKPWSTPETIHCKRDKRKTYSFLKNDAEKNGKLLLTEDIDSFFIPDFYIMKFLKEEDIYITFDLLLENLSIENKALNKDQLKSIFSEKLKEEEDGNILYFLTDIFGVSKESLETKFGKVIEDFLSTIECSWDRAFSSIEELVAGKAKILVDRDLQQLILEFTVIQIFRNPRIMYSIIGSISSAIKNSIPIEINSHYQLLRLLYEYKIFKTSQGTSHHLKSAIETTITMMKKWRMNLIISPLMTNFFLQ